MLRDDDIVAGPIDAGTFDVVTARAVLHHVADADAAVRNLVASLKPGGGILLIEPDFLPVSVAEPSEVRAFWDGWLAWSREAGIDYHIGRTLAPFGTLPPETALSLARAQGMAVVTMRTLTSGVFQRWLAQVAPAAAGAIDWNAALLDYVLSHPQIDVALVGMRTTDEVDRNAAALAAAAYRLDLAALHDGYGARGGEGVRG